MKEISAVVIFGLLFWWMMMDRFARDKVYYFGRDEMMRAGVALRLIRRTPQDSTKSPVDTKGGPAVTRANNTNERNASKSR